MGVDGTLTGGLVKEGKGGGVGFTGAGFGGDIFVSFDFRPG